MLKKVYIDEDLTVKLQSASGHVMRFYCRVRKRLPIAVSSGYELVRVDQIMHARASESYTEVFIADGKKFLCSKTLKTIEQLLHGNNFIRIHQSHLVNPDFVVRIIKCERSSVVLENGLVIPIARSRKKETINFLMSI